VPVDWQALHQGERRRRVPLPTYPFERRRHWIEPERTVRSSAGAAPLAPETADPSGWLHLPSWRRSLPPLAPRGEAVGDWVVFLDVCGLGEALAERLALAGHGVVRISPDEDAGDPASLLARLRDQGRTLRGILHLRSVTPAVPGFEEAWSAGFTSLAGLTRALLESGVGEILVAITNGAQRVTGEEALCPAKATLLGWVRTASHADRPLRCRALDVFLPAPGSLRWVRLVDRLTAEVLSKASEPLVAWRGDDRWVPALEPAPLGAPDRRVSWLRPGGVYLLTGGLDGLAFAMARRMAAAAPVRLAFVAPPGHGAEEAPNRIRALEELGAEVLVLEAEPGDSTALWTVLARVEELWGPLHALFYLPGPAGAPGPTGPLGWMRGALVLDRLLGDEKPLDAFVIFTWMEPPAGAPARAELWAASALLDALAQERTARGARPTVAIDWGRGVGFDTDEASEVLDRILAHLGVPQVVVSAPVLAEPPHTQEKDPAAAAATEAEEDEGWLADDPVAARITAIWREVLGVDRIGPRDRFFDLGGDSLIALRVMARLRETFPVDLPVRTLFERATVPGLRDAVEEALTAQLEALSEAEAQHWIERFLA